MGPAVASPKERTILPKPQVLARRTMHRTPAACCGIAGGQEPCDVLALAVLAIRRIGMRGQDEIERHLELRLVPSLDGNTAASATPQDQIMAWSVLLVRPTWPDRRWGQCRTPQAGRHLLDPRRWMSAAWRETGLWPAAMRPSD